MYDPIRLEIFKNLFASVAEEMGVTLCRTSFSPNIKERRDFSCAIFDKGGDMVVQAAHIPVHLGSMPLSVLSAIQHVPHLEPGDAVILNDTFKGGTHLPDITLVSPVFLEGIDTPVLFVANRAHHADVGGMTPGSMPLSTEIFQEGIRIPPVKIAKRGVIERDLLDLILANVRTPEEREGDLTAQFAANNTGVRRLIEVIQKYGFEEVQLYMRELQGYAERMTRKAIEEIPDGEYTFEDYLDNDGITDDPVKIAVKITIQGDSATLDFSGSSPQVRGSLNANHAITLSATFYVFRCIIEADIPSNSGGMVPLNVIVPPGTVVNANFPAAVAGGNVETSQRITDVILGALAKAIPEKIPAASSGTMNNLTIGGYDPFRQKGFAYYETIGGGMGARPTMDGIDAVHTHMTNTMNTPLEALEHEYPFRVAKYAIRRGSGGAGRFRGGDGIVREVELLCDARVTILSERRNFPPYGLQGGQPGARGENRLIRGDEVITLPSKVSLPAKAGDIISISTPGGGGYGVSVS
ncbi:MAG: hydantoinase B/oxoprolinase family protein [Candidatus Tectomicrobia bacterium]|nr:hydantoinase B/oxoprolinase family protein [Candidatus Tectomicrobia bacterium]